MWKTALKQLKKLRWNLALLAVCALVAIAAGVAGESFVKGVASDERSAVAEQRDIRAKLARARDEERDLRGKIERYRDLDARGLIGQEHRLDWVEQIRKIKQARRLIDVQYELAPQQPLDPALLPGGAGAFEFMSSTMRLQMALLHEEDLLTFLADLRDNVQAFIRVRNCSVERIGADSDRAASAAQLSAQCLVDWITLREKK